MMNGEASARVHAISSAGDAPPSAAVGTFPETGKAGGAVCGVGKPPTPTTRAGSKLATKAAGASTQSP
jgi:hypothetical protein